MDHRKNYASGFNQFGESRFLSSFSQSKCGRSGEPTPKKPKLEISKSCSQSKSDQSEEQTPKKPSGFCLGLNGTTSNQTNSPLKPVNNKKDAIDDILWGEDFLDQEGLAQVDNVVEEALSQMTVLTQSKPMSTLVQVKQNVVTNATQSNQVSLPDLNKTVMRNNMRVPLRRFGSSQYPSSSTINSSHANGVQVNRKDTANAAFLHTDLEQLRLENKKLKEDFNKKAGEARILRDKMNCLEKEKDKIKREYVVKFDSLRAETEQNHNNLMKQIKSLKGQLDVKNMEIKTAERRAQMSSSVNRIQPNSPNRRPGTSLRPSDKESSLQCEFSRGLMKAKTQGLPLKFIRESIAPELLEPSQPEAAFSESANASNPRLFSGLLGAEGSNASTSRSRGIVARTDLRMRHTSITPCAAILLDPQLGDISSGGAQQAMSEVVDRCHQILTELLKQLESAVCSNSSFIERERKLLLSGAKCLPLDRDYNLISHRELYTDERGIPARRALSLMSLLVQASDFAANKVLSSNPKNTTEILDTLRNLVQQVEKQRRTLIFQGVLAAAASLIKNLLASGVTISKENQLLMVDILRWVVSARPGSLAIANILEALLAAARYPHIINALCHNSGEKTYKENPRHAIIQFTPDSCILQVLCSLLKSAETPRKYYLTDLLTLWVLSLFCGGQPRPAWLTAAPTTKTCRCHSLVCKLCFSLLSEACFAHPTVTGVDRACVERVLRRGVLLTNSFMDDDEHLMAIVDAHSLGCYEHFLHFMGDAKIKLDTNTREILGFLCTQEEVLKQPGSSANTAASSQLYTALGSFETGENGKTSHDILDALESL